MINDKFVSQQGVYLLSHSVGLPLQQAEVKAAEQYWQPWCSADDLVWDSWLGTIEGFRLSLAVLLNTQAGNLCPQTSISEAVNKVIFSLTPEPTKPIILMSEEDFPSVGFALQQARHLGYTMRYIPRGTDLNDLTVWDSYLSADVGFVLITQVQSNNGVQLPVAEITAMAAERSIYSIVDAAQGVGILPVNLQQWSASFVVGSCVKWLCGGPGAAFLWVNPDIISECRPQNVGWFSHENPFEFDIHNFRLADDALRFWGGTPSVYPFAVAQQGVEFFVEVGIDKVRRHNLTLSDRVIECLLPGELVSPTNPEFRSGTLIINFGDCHQRLTALLKDHGVAFDQRDNGIRLSPHIYNTKSQIDTFVELVRLHR